MGESAVLAKLALSTHERVAKSGLVDVWGGSQLEFAVRKVTIVAHFTMT
jgi:hypothetical protein